MEDFSLYAVDVFWNGNWKAIDVECTESDSLLGMAILEQSRLIIDVVVGGRVTIDCSI